MRTRPTPAASAVALLVMVAVSLLGVRLFLPGTASACAAETASCCCPGDAPEREAASGEGGCDCSISPATPVPAAVLAPTDGFVPPVLVAEVADAAVAAAPDVATREALPAPRARSAPTQELLETFRN